MYRLTSPIGSTWERDTIKGMQGLMRNLIRREALTNENRLAWKLERIDPVELDIPTFLKIEHAKATS